MRSIEWRRITDKVKIETILLQQNKHHLQQMASEFSPLSMNYFNKVTDNFRASLLADKLLDGEITDELASFPPTVRAWLLKFKRSNKERKSRPIDGFIFPDEFQQAFKVANEKMSSSPSGIHCTFWKRISTNSKMAHYCSVIM